MSVIMKQAVQKSLHKLGLRVQRISNDDIHRLVRTLEANRIEIVLDVGANIGQFARSLREAGFRGEIVCFEPLPTAHAALQEAFRNDAGTTVHPRVALGSERSTIDINVAANSVSSSVLDMLDAHRQAAPDSEYVATESAELLRLDDVFHTYVGEGKRSFLKIDTQGYEWNVLDGAAESLPRIDGLLLEMSLVPLYEGQRLWRQLIDRLESAGFSLWQIFPGFTDPSTGRCLQFDAVLYRHA
ncbi:MAG: FkbM family methyltransferase [Gammaproteobacteria bacterium]